MTCYVRKYKYTKYYKILNKPTIAIFFPETHVCFGLKMWFMMRNKKESNHIHKFETWFLRQILNSLVLHLNIVLYLHQLDHVKQIWYLSPMRAAKVQASLRIRAVSPEPSLLAHTSSESRGTFRKTARSLAPLNGLACAVKICHDGMLEDTNSLDGAQLFPLFACQSLQIINRRVDSLTSHTENDSLFF